MKRPKSWQVWIPTFIIVPVFVGWICGWYVGASQTPIVATLLPLIFGLFGAIGYGVIDKKVKAESVYEQLSTMDDFNILSTSIKNKIRSFESISVPTWLPLWWSIGVAIFCVSCFFGTSSGVAARIPQYEDIPKLLGNKLEVSPLETAYLYSAKQILSSQGVSKTDAISIFQNVFRPILADKNTSDDMLAALDTAQNSIDLAQLNEEQTKTLALVFIELRNDYSKVGRQQKLKRAVDVFAGKGSSFSTTSTPLNNFNFDFD